MPPLMANEKPSTVVHVALKRISRTMTALMAELGGEGGGRVAVIVLVVVVVVVVDCF